MTQVESPVRDDMGRLMVLGAQDVDALVWARRASRSSTPTAPSRCGAANRSLPAKRPSRSSA